MSSTLTVILAVVAGIAVAAPDVAAASYNTTSLSALYGTGFDDPHNGMASQDERIFTLRLENSLGWRYGDSYVYIDMTSGRFAEDGSTDYNIYAKWVPRLSLSKILGTQIGVGPLGDVLLAADIQRSPGFSAVMTGIGTSWDVPGFDYVTLNMYVRNDNFNDPTYQVAAIWRLPFRLGASFSFEGHFTIYGTDAQAVNVLSQPQLLVKAGEWVGLREDQLQIGTEVWIAHTTDSLGERYTTVAPTVMARFVF